MKILKTTLIVALALAGVASCTKYERQEKPRHVFDVSKAEAVDTLQHIYKLNDILFYYDEPSEMVVRIPENFSYSVDTDGARFFSRDSLMILTAAAHREALPEGVEARTYVKEMFEQLTSDTPLRLRELNDSVVSGEGVEAGRPFFAKWGYTTDSLGVTLRTLRCDYEPIEMVEEKVEKMFPVIIAPFPSKTDTTVVDEETDWI